MTEPLTLRFDQQAATVVNAIVAVMMFGASLTLTPADFGRVVRTPRALLTGVAVQYVLFPGLVCLLGWLLPIEPGLALGAIFVASLPGGSFSNVLTWMARGNTALSIGMTAFASLAAPVLTPASFALWGTLNPRTRDAMRDVTLPPEGVLTIVLAVLVAPILSGMWVGHRFPGGARRAERPLRTVTLVVFFAFIAGMFAANRALFVQRFHEFFWVTAGTNALALALGVAVARLAGLATADGRAIGIEVGIKNAGLGLVLLITFFPQGEGLLLVTAFWGVWHLVTGVAVAQWWARRPDATAASPGDGAPP